MDKVDLRPFWFPVGGSRDLLLGSESIYQIFIDRSAVFHLPDLAVTHDIDDFQLSHQIVDKQLDGFHAEVVLQFLDICGLVHDFHYVLGALLVVDPVNAAFREPLRQLLHYVVASLNDFGPGERLHLQEGVSCVKANLPELILIFGIKTSYFDLS